MNAPKHNNDRPPPPRPVEAQAKGNVRTDLTWVVAKLSELPNCQQHSRGKETMCLKMVSRDIKKLNKNQVFFQGAATTVQTTHSNRERGVDHIVLMYGIHAFIA
jgi:hypothetical protein